MIKPSTNKKSGSSHKKNFYQSWVQRVQFWFTRRRCPELSDVFENDSMAIESLEDRVMLSGSADTSVDETGLSGMFDLPAEVGQVLSQTMLDSGKFTEGAWQADSVDSVTESIEWGGANITNSHDQNAWETYNLDDGTPLGSSSSTNLDFIANDGGGYFVFLQQTDKERTLETPPPAGSGLPGGIGGGTGLDGGVGGGAVQIETRSSDITTNVVWAATQAEVDSIQASGSVDLSSFTSYLSITVSTDFKYEDFGSTSSAVRSYTVSSSYEIDATYIWKGTDTTVSTDEDGGTSTFTINYDMFGTAQFEGWHKYEGKVIQGPGSDLHEEFIATGAGSSQLAVDSDNSASSSYFLDTDTLEIISSSSGSEDILLTTTTTFEYDDRGSRSTAGQDRASSMTRKDTSQYNLTSASDFSTEYETAEDFTYANADSQDSGDGNSGSGGSESGGSESSEENNEATTFSTGSFTASGNSSDQSNLTTHGNSTVMLSSFHQYGGGVTTTTSISGFDYSQLSGSYQMSDQGTRTSTNVGRYSSTAASQWVDMTYGSTNEVITSGLVTSIQTEFGGDLETLGVVEIKGQLLDSNTSIDSGFTSDHRYTNTTSDAPPNESASPYVETESANQYTQSYVPIALQQNLENLSAPTQSQDEGAGAYSAAGHSSVYLFSAAAGQSSFTAQNDGIGKSDIKFEYLAGGETSLTLSGDSSVNTTSSSSTAISEELRVATGTATNGSYSHSSFSANNTSSGHGNTSGNYNMNYRFTKEAVQSGSDSGGEDGSGTSTGEQVGGLVLDMDKVVRSGYSNGSFSSTIDSDVTHTRDKGKSAGNITIGDVSSGNYTTIIWNDNSDFSETTDGSSSASGQSGQQFSEGTETNTNSGTSSGNHTITGNGSSGSHYEKHVRATNQTIPEFDAEGNQTESSKVVGSYEMDLVIDSAKSLVSNGGGSSQTSSDLTNKVIDTTIVTEDGERSGTDGTTGPGGPGGPGSGPGEVIDPENIFEIGDKKFINSGSSSVSGNSNYGIDTTSPSFSMTFHEKASGMVGFDNDLILKETDSSLKSENNAPHTNVSSSDNSSTISKWEADGLHLLSNGTSTVTVTTSGEEYNPELATTKRVYQAPDASYTKTIKTEIDPLAYKSTYNNTLVTTTTAEDYGSVISFAEDTNSDQVLEAGEMPILTSTKGTGKLTTEISKTGGETYKHKSKRTQILNRPGSGLGTDIDNISRNEWSNWDPTDKVVVTFNDDGSSQRVQTAGGGSTYGQTLSTDGSHDHNFQTINSDGWHQKEIQVGSYDSLASINGTVTRSGSITTDFDADNKATATTGSITAVNHAIGTATADSESSVTLAKWHNISYEVAESNHNAEFGNTFDADFAATTDDSITVNGTETVTAFKSRIIDNEDAFDATTTTTLTGQIDSEGKLSIDEDEQTENSVHGSAKTEIHMYTKKELELTNSAGDAVASTEYTDAPDIFITNNSYGTETIETFGFSPKEDSVGKQFKPITTQFSPVEIPADDGNVGNSGDDGSGSDGNSGDDGDDGGGSTNEGNASDPDTENETVNVDVAIPDWVHDKFHGKGRHIKLGSSLTALDWTRIIAEAYGQTYANAANGVTDTAITLLNTPFFLLNFGAWLTAGDDYKYIDYIPEWDWSRNLVSRDMTDTGHFWSKMAGGEALTLGFGKLVKASGVVSKIANSKKGGAAIAAASRLGLNGKPTKVTQAVTGAVSSVGSKLVGGLSKRFGKTGDINKGLPIVDNGLNFLKNGGCFVSGTHVRLNAKPAAVATGKVTRTTTTPALAPQPTITTAIENVPLGSRVPDQNPSPENTDFSLGEVDQGTWRQIDVRLRRKDGAVVEMQLLRPAAWIERRGLTVDCEFTPRLNDTEIHGNATVIAIGPCPEITDCEGSVVTGRFVTRQVNNLIEVKLENGTTFTGTSTHPVWIPADREWVRLGNLEVGQQLDTISGPLTVEAISRIGDVSDVFNIEVHRHHVYRITKDGVLVHNNCLEEAIEALRNGNEYLWDDGFAKMLVRRTGNTIEAIAPIYTEASDFHRMIFGLEDIASEFGAKTVIVRNVGLGFGPKVGNAAKTRRMLERYGGVFEHVGDDILGKLYDITFRVK